MTHATITVFTPTHDPRFLREAFESLKAQTRRPDQWVVLLNNGAAAELGTLNELDAELDATPWVTVIDHGAVAGVGEAKRATLEHATGELLVELDHDDELHPLALESLAAGAEHRPDASLFYSDFTQVDEHGAPVLDRWDPANGWTYRTAPGGYLVPSSFEPYPTNVAQIWFAPNHLRAFTRAAYDQAGGYSPELAVGDDLDLMVRLYQVGPFCHLATPAPLYRQRIHAGNTQAVPELNDAIQYQSRRLFDEHVQGCALAWARRQGLRALDMGAAHNPAPGFEAVDRRRAPGVDVVWDADEGPLYGRWGGDELDVGTSSVGVIRCSDFLEHLRNPVAFLNECYRLLAHGGVLITNTPSTDGRGAFQDPTHVSFWNEHSWWYYTDARYSRFVPEFVGRFMAPRLVTYQTEPTGVMPYVWAVLVAVKDGPRLGGPLAI